MDATLRGVVSLIMRLGVYSSALLLGLGISVRLTIPWMAGELLMRLGFLTLISTPIAAVASSAILSAVHGDRRLTLTSTLVLLILILGVALGVV